MSSSTALVKPRHIITAHANADFDAIAAMVAAGKLYPEATLITPSMIVRQESHPFTDRLRDIFSMRQARECDFSAVNLLVVVDTRNPERLPHIAEVLELPDLEVHVYDHHPPASNDLPASMVDMRAWGATTSILVSILEKKGIALTPDEATMLALGIYEDTGKFSFPATTPHDFEAAAYLARHNLNFKVVADLTKGDLTRQQVHVLDELLSNAVMHNINGVAVTLAEISLDSFLGDFATIVTRLMEMENLKVVFALAAMGDRIHIIARSSVEVIDVGTICKFFGGGGHPEAAAASIKDKTLAQTKAELVAYLVTTVASKITVGTHMTSPAKTLLAETPITEANEIMERFGLKAAPVVREATGECVGILELQTAARATSHKLGKQPAKEYMQRSFEFLEPKDDMHRALDIILQQRQRLIPIIQEGQVAGVLTRTDLLRIMVDETLRLPDAVPMDPNSGKSRFIDLDESLPEEVVSILRSAGALADNLKMTVFTVGGFVRDLCLKQHNLDIDLTIEGDISVYADALARLFNGTVRHHRKFKTAVIKYTNPKGEEARIDVATARMEYYEQPAALPSVDLASIKMDLYRRDFTINAQAVQLNKLQWGQLIDPFGGQRDIKNKAITVLHSLSMVEDPTRILRAVRFEQRFGFRISSQTERLIKNSLSLNMMGRLSGSRLFNEMKHVFDEKTAVECIHRLEGWGVWKAIHPRLALTPSKKHLLTSLEEVLGWYRLLYKDPPPVCWVMYLMALCTAIKPVDLAVILERLGFIPKEKKAFTQERTLIHRASITLINRHKLGTVQMSSLYEALSPLTLEGHLYMMARYGQEHNIGKDVSLFLTSLKYIKTDVSGDDLTEMGYPRGPIIGRMLHLILMAKLDGLATKREDQILLASNYLLQARVDTFESPTLQSLIATTAPEIHDFDDDRR